jgi:hypothetical protein
MLHNQGQQNASVRCSVTAAAAAAAGIHESAYYSNKIT